jgi:Ca-activated chloride channel family protein
LWLFAIGLVVLATGAARPQASVPVPSNSATILLAIDVSARCARPTWLPTG